MTARRRGGFSERTVEILQMAWPIFYCSEILKIIYWIEILKLPKSLHSKTRAKNVGEVKLYFSG